MTDTGVDADTAKIETEVSKSELITPLGLKPDNEMTMEALLGWRYRVFLLPFEESRKFKAPTPTQYLRHMDWLIYKVKMLQMELAHIKAGDSQLHFGSNGEP